MNFSEKKPMKLVRVIASALLLQVFSGILPQEALATDTEVPVCTTAEQLRLDTHELQKILNSRTIRTSEELNPEKIVGMPDIGSHVIGKPLSKEEVTKLGLPPLPTPDSLNEWKRVD